ncbi:hypothetical protein M9458_018566, partial [Cirrhinus mrigala]
MGPASTVKQLKKSTKKTGCWDEPPTTVNAQPSLQRASGKTITGQIQRSTLTAGAAGN